MKYLNFNLFLTVCLLFLFSLFVGSSVTAQENERKGGREETVKENEETESFEQEESDQDTEEEDDEDDEDEEDEEEEEEEEEFRVTDKEVLSFVRKQLPEFMEHIQEHEDDEEAKEIILEEGREVLLGFLEIKEAHGRRLGEKYLELFRVDFAVERLLQEFEDKEPDADHKPQLKKEIRQLVTRRYSLQLALEKAELNRLKAEVEDFEEEIRHRAENREELIDEESQELLEELGAADDDEDEDDDEESGDEDNEDGDDKEGDDDEGDSVELKKKA